MARVVSARSQLHAAAEANGWSIMMGIDRDVFMAPVRPEKITVVYNTLNGRVESVERHTPVGPRSMNAKNRVQKVIDLINQ